MADAKNGSVPWGKVREEEFKYLGFDLAKDPEETEPQGVGLAFSGGGIRSAAFCLGVMQALAKHGKLRQIDYLSTVSGGGYIGAWLSGFLHRADKLEPDASGKGAPRISPEQEAAIADVNEPSLKYIRRFSNYLTPKTGLSRDFLATVGIVISNILLSLAIGGALLFGLCLAVLTLGGWLVDTLTPVPSVVATQGALWIALALLIAGSVLLLPSIKGILDRLYGDGAKSVPATAAKPCASKMTVASITLKIAMALLIVALPMLSLPIASALVEHGHLSDRAAHALGKLQVMSRYPLSDWRGWPAMFGAVYLLFNVPLILLSIWEFLHLRRGEPKWKIMVLPVLEAVSAFVAGIVGGLVIVAVFKLLGGRDLYAWTAVSVGVPIVLLVVLVTLTTQMMLWRRAMPTELREWWYRVFAGLVAFALAWALLFGAAIIGPALFRSQSIAWLISIGTAWAGSAAFAAFLALGKNVGKASESTIVAKLTPVAIWIVVLGILLGGFAAAFYLSGAGRDISCKDFPSCIVSHAALLSEIALGRVCEALLILLGLIVFLNAFYNVNLHSMNQLYRNRLVRCFLGASNPTHDERAPSGFDESDDLPLSQLKTQRPLHIVCTALNLTGSRELAWQTRKAGSFMMTALFSGFALPRMRRSDASDKSEEDAYFVPTEDYMQTKRSKEGVSIGSAITISGAAASPAQGYHTNKALAFIMALLNVRIGRWCPNPQRGQKFVRRQDPRSGVLAFLAEQLGMTNERARFVYLSDGGHFDNMGLYELIRRRCKKIYLVDAEQDGEWKFEGLSEGIRKARLDFGAEVLLTTKSIVPQDGGRYSNQSYEKGEVRYKDGTKASLLYFKLSLPSSGAAEVPMDVYGYAAAKPDFPHQSTADQWFDESQFESYRKLGLAVGTQGLTAPLSS